MSREGCSALVTVARHRMVRCTGCIGHGPAEDTHQGLLRVTVHDGREHAASLVWSTTLSPWEADLITRAD